jgi:hypothetical protein
VSIIQAIAEKRDELARINHELNVMTNENNAKRQEYRNKMQETRRFTSSKRDKEERAELESLTREENALRDRYYITKSEIVKFLAENRDTLTEEIKAMHKKEVLDYEKSFIDAYKKGLKLRDKLNSLKTLTPELFMPLEVLTVHVPFQQGNSMVVSDLQKLTESTKFYK